jgi:type 1 glutamine amidotransferase
MHEFVVTVRKDHPITRGVASFNHGRDELYQNSLLTPGSTTLVTAYSDLKKDPKNTGKDEPVVWTNQYGKGRVVQNSLGHDVEAMRGAGFRTLMIRCVEWAATGDTTYEAPRELGKK